MNTYITTTIPYVNAQPHVGFALELVQADAIARLHRRAHHPVRLQTGTDENAFKNVEAARRAGVEVQTWVDQHAAEFQKLADALSISYDRFFRTTDVAHVRAVQAFWRSLRPGDLYSKPYIGLYCSGCEDFVFEKDLVDGCCPEHATKPVEVSETNYFFRLSAYQEVLSGWLETVSIRPEWRRREIAALVRMGLPDISVSRVASRSGGWGIPVPDDPTQVIYVWIDALINYLAGIGYASDQPSLEWWSGWKLHVLGKNVVKFHALYWPALLASAGLPLPDELVIHGFLTANRQKIGKSNGNAISADSFIERYGGDAVRYFLLRAIPAFEDGDFSIARFSEIYESDLVNGLGNLTSRILSLAIRSGIDALSRPGASPPSDDYERACREYQHDVALAEVWRRIDAVNRAIEIARPWESLKRGDAAAVQTRVLPWLADLAAIARDIDPFLPITAAKLRTVLSSNPLRTPAPLFPRIR